MPANCSSPWHSPRLDQFLGRASPSPPALCPGWLFSQCWNSGQLAHSRREFLHTRGCDGDVTCGQSQERRLGVCPGPTGPSGFMHPNKVPEPAPEAASVFCLRLFLCPVPAPGCTLASSSPLGAPTASKQMPMACPQAPSALDFGALSGPQSPPSTHSDMHTLRCTHNGTLTDSQRDMRVHIHAHTYTLRLMHRHACTHICVQTDSHSSEHTHLQRCTHT